MSSSAAACLPITAMQYLDVGRSKPEQSSAHSAPLVQKPSGAVKRAAEIELSHEEFAAKINRERADAAAEAERRVREECDAKLVDLQSRTARVIAQFEAQRSEYFGRVEAEVVQLALSIAAKILHREAQVDPMVVAGLVRITLEQMREGSSITFRVNAGGTEAWRDYFADHPRLAEMQFVEDPKLEEGDCVLETELGSAHLGLERQLKEIERGFFDLLALRPGR